jgi:hypothetical protein
VAADAPAAPHTEVEAALRALAIGRAPGPLAITYSDLHGLWGGISATLTEDGALTLTSREPGGPEVVHRRQLHRAEVAAVARLLLRQEAWAQRVPERPPVPDESRSTLTIRCAGAAVSIWEPHRDLARLGRLRRVRDCFLIFAGLQHQ